MLFDHPDLRRIDKRRTEVNEARAKWIARRAEMARRFDEAVSAHRRAMEAALLSGEEPPEGPDPEQYVMQGTLDVFNNALAQLAAEESQVLAKHAGEFRASLDATADRGYARIRPHVEAIVTAARELEAVRQAHRALDIAVGRPAGMWGWGGDEVTAERLVSSCLDGSEFVGANVEQEVSA